MLNSNSSVWGKNQNSSQKVLLSQFLFYLISSSRVDMIWFEQDGLLGKIVSKIPLEEAVRTSVLSKRWKYIWTSVPNLYVSGPDFGTLLMRFDYDEEIIDALLEEKTNKAVEGMNILLNQHCGSGVETFKVDLPFYEKHAGSLDRWVAFAAAANTKELVMRLQTVVGCLHSGPEIYEFPFHLLFQQKQQSSIEHLYFETCSLHVPPGIGCLSLLQTLELYLVSMDDVDFQNLVTTCPVMERLVVERCPGLVDMRIHQQSGQLKHLTVEHCPFLKSIDVRGGAHLVTLSYGGEKIEFSFDDASRVKELFIYFSYFADFLDYILLTLPNVVPHCQKLSLRFDHGTNYKLIGAPEIIYPRFEHLKHLKVTMDVVMGDNLLWLVPLLAAAPFLEKFSLSLDEEDSYMPVKMQVRNFPLAYLEDVEIDGFTGSRGQLTFLGYLLKNASSLKSMKIIRSSCCYTEEGCVEILPCELEKIRDHLKRIPSHQRPSGHSGMMVPR